MTWDVAENKHRPSIVCKNVQAQVRLSGRCIILWHALSLGIYVHIYICICTLRRVEQRVGITNTIPRLLAFSVCSYSTSMHTRGEHSVGTIFARYLFRRTSKRARGTRTHEDFAVVVLCSVCSMYIYICTCQHPGSKCCNDLPLAYTVCRLVPRKWGSLTTARGTLL